MAQSRAYMCASSRFVSHVEPSELHDARECPQITLACSMLLFSWSVSPIKGNGGAPAAPCVRPLLVTRAIFKRLPSRTTQTTILRMQAYGQCWYALPSKTMSENIHRCLRPVGHLTRGILNTHWYKTRIFATRKESIPCWIMGTSRAENFCSSSSTTV